MQIPARPASKSRSWTSRSRATAASSSSCLALPDQVGDALTVLGRRAVQRTVHGVPAEERVQVVLERDTDPAVDLHAVLQQLGAVRADERLGHAHELGRVPRARYDG